MPRKVVKTYLKQSMWLQWFNLKFMKWWEYFLCAKKQNDNFIQQFPLFHQSPTRVHESTTTRVWWYETRVVSLHELSKLSSCGMTISQLMQYTLSCSVGIAWHWRHLHHQLFIALCVSEACGCGCVAASSISFSSFSVYSLFEQVRLCKKNAIHPLCRNLQT